MKSFSELTELELYKLQCSKAELREQALLFAKDHEDPTDLYFAARRFSETVREIGMDHLWKQPKECSC